ncbi:MAG: SPOR domain-containing protein [Treponema sp.]|nr:SPOR domain-containing protein [Treponema sp.]
MSMTKYTFIALGLLFAPLLGAGAAETTAKAAAEKAAKEASVTESIAYLTKTIPALTEPQEKRSLYAFLGGVQEQAGLYADAVKSYALAAGIAAGDAPGMSKKSAEQLVLDAVRSALSSGDTATADSYLNSAVRSSKNEQILAHVKLYEQWSALCKSTGSAGNAEAIAMLKTYSTLPSMKAVQPQVLLTLWHITGEKNWANTLKKQFPKSPEAAIVQGSAQLLPAPFWYFVPRVGDAVPEVEQAAISESTGPAVKTAGESAAEKASAASEKVVKQQLGLFREEANAKALVEKAGAKGFKAYITSEVRPSGNKYYLVVVDENAAGTIAAELRNAGFDCYPLF